MDKNMISPYINSGVLENVLVFAKQISLNYNMVPTVHALSRKNLDLLGYLRFFHAQTVLWGL